MKARFTVFSLWLLLLFSCRRDVLPLPSILRNDTVVKGAPYIDYIIHKGEQFCDKNFFIPVDYRIQKFSVIFDSSAVYTSTGKANQGDINKLYGFSDNDVEHHLNSARIGWRWSDGGLRLFAYVYNNGQIASEEITEVIIGREINCSIEVAGNKYNFNVDGIPVSLARASTTQTGRGYKLYPYFGGD